MRAFFNGRPAGHTPARRPLGGLCLPISTLCFLLLLTAGTIWSQAPTWASSDLHQWSTLPASGQLDVGQTFEVVLELGTALAPADDVLGIDMDLPVTGAQPVGTPPAANIVTSWLLDANDSIATGWTGDVLHVEGVRSDSTGTEGHGEVVRFLLEVTDEEFDLANFSLDGGGLVLVDNVDMKRLPSEPVPQWTIWPNPVHESVHVRRPTAKDQYYVLLNEWGQTVWESERPAPLEWVVDVAHLPPGTYFLRGMNEEGTATVVQTLWVR